VALGLRDLSVFSAPAAPVGCEKLIQSVFLALWPCECQKPAADGVITPHSLIGKLKHFRRVFARYDKYARRFLAFVHFASMTIWLK
jgi:transposase